MDWKIKELKNGIKLVTIRRPWTKTVAVRAFVRAGSRYEESHHGLAHLAEHMLLKGTLHRTRQQIFAQVEETGGEISAGTTKEYSTFFVVSLSQCLPTAIEALADLIISPLLAENDFLFEKNIILEEARRAQDKEAFIFDLFAQARWQNHPFRFPILANQDKIAKLTHQDLLDFFRSRYAGLKTTVCICGGLEHRAALKVAQEAFSPMPRGQAGPPAAVVETPLKEVRKAHLEKDLNQTHLLLGVPGPSMSHKDRSALKLIEIIMGRGLNSRLYKRLREKEGLVYSALALLACFEDTGYFSVKTACHPQRLEKVKSIILEEWAKLKRKECSQAELAAAKRNYEGNLARQFETNLSLATIFGIEALLDEIEPFEQALARIAAVTAGEIKQVARRYLDTENYVLASLGPAP